jgi:hypothetical protein
MKKYSLILIMVLGVITPVITPSCTNLEEEFFSDLTTANFPQTRNELIAALASSYTNLYTYGNHNNYHSLIEVASDEAVIPHRGADWFDGGLWIRTHQHRNTPQDGAVNNAWDVMYRGVGICNDLIITFRNAKEAEEPAVSPEEADAFIAELRALRAMYYYWLMDIFGNIPIVTEPEDPTNIDLSPATQPRADVFAFIVSELNEVSSLLPKEHGVSTYGRVNYYTAQAILAKVYLNAEVYIGAARWAEAVAACDELINSNQFALTDNYFDNFAADNDNGSAGTSENIFVIPFDAVQAPGFNLHHMTMHYSNQATFQLQESPWNGYCTLADFYNSYDDADLRKGEFGVQLGEGNFFAGPQFGADGTTRLTDTGFETEDPDGAPLTFTPELNELEPNALRQAGVRIHKFEVPNGAPNSLSADFPIFRYSDILLMKAEALWQQNNGSQDALDLANQVRARAGVAEFPSLNADNLLAERGREMFFEGWRRQDLIRFGRYNDSWYGKPASDPTKNIFPIPQAKINTNPNIVQNPGY